MFLIRTVLLFVGGDTEADVGGDLGAGYDDTDVSFKLLSLQGLTAFFMMFGLVGLAMSRQSGLNEFWSVTGGFVAGTITMAIIGQIFVSMKKLQFDGTLNMANAVGEEGTVYLTIPADGTGKARIAIQEHLKVFDAVPANKEEIKTGEQIKVVKVISGNILVVEKAR